MPRDAQSAARTVGARAANTPSVGPREHILGMPARRASQGHSPRMRGQIETIRTGNERAHRALHGGVHGERVRAAPAELRTRHKNPP